MIPCEGKSLLSTWLAIHLAAGIPSYQNKSCETHECYSFLVPNGRAAYPALTPENVTLAAYKLLGEAVIAMMGPGCQEPWLGDLYAFETIYWLRPGPVPWQLVLVLLATWTLLVVSASILTLFTKRWTLALSGFDFFRFGAQFSDQVNSFSSRRFDWCDALHVMPGMVGVMEG